MTLSVSRICERASIIDQIEPYETRAGKKKRQLRLLRLRPYSACHGVSPGAVRESAESPRPMRRTSGNSPRSPGRLKASVPASKSASGRARTDLSDGIDIAVDQNAEPTDWDDALAEFLLHFVRTRPRALDKTGGDQDDNGSRQ